MVVSRDENTEKVTCRYSDDSAKDYDFTRKSRFIRRYHVHCMLEQNMHNCHNAIVCAVNEMCWLLGRRFSVSTIAEPHSRIFYSNRFFHTRFVFLFLLLLSLWGFRKYRHNDVDHRWQWQPPTIFVSICSIVKWKHKLFSAETQCLSVCLIAWLPASQPVRRVVYFFNPFFSLRFHFISFDSSKWCL